MAREIYAKGRCDYCFKVSNLMLKVRLRSGLKFDDKEYFICRDCLSHLTGKFKYVRLPK